LEAPRRVTPAINVIIPALNEERALGLVLDEIPPDLVQKIIVVDNGSTDGTASIARERGAVVLSEPRRGYGRALQSGIGALDASCEVVVVLDADHSDFPEDMPALIQPILDGRADFVVGSRVSGAQAGALLPQQRFGNWLTCVLIRLFFGFRFTDMGPFRAIRRRTLEDMRMEDKNFGWNVEMQVKAVRMQARILEVPVRYRPRIGQSKISGTIRGTVMAGAIILFSIYRYGFRRPTPM
jgi:glycosyltransferase involved in cell wall biosynthesis